MTPERTVLVERVIAAVCQVCDVTREEFIAPNLPGPQVSRARDLACFTLSGLVPDETAHGVAKLLSAAVGLSPEAWAKRLAEAAVAREIVLAAMQEKVDALLVDVEPIYRAMGRRQPRPVKSPAPAGSAGGNQPHVAVRDSAGARDFSSDGASMDRTRARIDGLRSTISCDAGFAFENGGGA